MSSKVELKTAPYDPRFPNTNQTRNCYQNFVDFHRCMKKKGPSETCEFFKFVYGELCPNEWIEKWETQIQEGNFAGRV